MSEASSGRNGWPGPPTRRASRAAWAARLLAAAALLAAAGPGVAQEAAPAQEARGPGVAQEAAGTHSSDPLPLTDAQRRAGIQMPEVGDRVRPGPDGWFACRNQRLVMAAWFAQLARHPGAVRALFANEGDEVDCVWLRPDDPSIAELEVIDAADSRFGEATIRTLKLRVRFANGPEGQRRAVEMFALAGVAGGLEVTP